MTLNCYPLNMSKQELSPEQIKEQNTERKHFDVPYEQKELKEDSVQMRNNAIAMLEMKAGSLEYEKDGDKILSVTVKNPTKEIIFFSQDSKDIEEFLKLEIPKSL